jgi:hypothetical protein
VDDFGAERDAVVRALGEHLDAEAAEVVLALVDVQLGPPPAIAAPDAGDVADLSSRVVVEQNGHVPDPVY